MAQEISHPTPKRQERSLGKTRDIEVEGRYRQFSSHDDRDAKSLHRDRHGIAGGEPIIVGTRTTVRAVVEIWRMGVMPEKIPLHLSHLTQAQVFDALSYFSDHEVEINSYIERNSIPEDLIDPRVNNL